MNTVNRTPVCSECPGRCCSFKRFAWGYLILDRIEEDAPRFRGVRKRMTEGGRERGGISLKPRCPFLGRDNRCSIYRHRPNACKGAICYTDPNAMALIDRYPTHKKLLRRWKVLPGQKYGIRECDVPKTDDNSKST